MPHQKEKIGIMTDNNPAANYRSTWSEIDLNAIRDNFLKIKSMLDKDTSIMAAVKANAYGHGIIAVSDLLVRSGADYLGVATTDEALHLRKNSFKVPILILGSILPGEIDVVIKNSITQTVGDLQLARALNDHAARLGKKARVHIKVDTGMGRIGIWHEQALSFVKRLSGFKSLLLEGIFTHFPDADDDKEITCRQIEDFNRLLHGIEALGIVIKYKHMANSAATLAYKDSHMNLVRPGLMIYGLYPNKTFSKKIKLMPALSLKSRVVFIKDVPPGRSISYGGTYKTTGHTRLATIPIGYGDGYSRGLSNIGSVLVRGRRAPIRGIICMDQTVIDVGHIPGVRVGDEVVIIGSQQREHIDVEEIARLCHTIPYEVACWFNNRVQKKYISFK